MSVLQRKDLCLSTKHHRVTQDGSPSTFIKLSLSAVVLLVSCSQDDVPPTSTAWPVIDGGLGTGVCAEGSDASRCAATQCLQLVRHQDYNQLDLVSRCRASLFFVIPPELLWENDEGPFDMGGPRADLLGGYWWMARNGERIALTTQTTWFMGQKKATETIEPMIYEVKPGERLRIHVPISRDAARLDGCKFGVAYPTVFQDCSDQHTEGPRFTDSEFEPEDELTFSLVLPLPFDSLEDAQAASFAECGRYCDHPDSVPCSSEPDHLYLENVVTMSGERFSTTCPDFSEGFNTIE